MKKNVLLFLSIVWLALAAGTVGLQPLGSTKPSFTAPGCGVDSQCAWYKISVRSAWANPELRFWSRQKNTYDSK